MVIKLKHIYLWNVHKLWTKYCFKLKIQFIQCNAHKPAHEILVRLDMWPAKAKIHLHINAVSPEASLPANTKYELMNWTKYFTDSRSDYQSKACDFKFDLILYLPVNNFSVMSGQVFLGWTSTK